MVFLDLDVPGCNPEYTHRTYVYFSSQSLTFSGNLNYLYPLLFFSSGVRYSIIWAGVFIFDLGIFVLTLNKALRMGLRHRYTLWRVLLRDGTIYFWCVHYNIANL